MSKLLTMIPVLALALACGMAPDTDLQPRKLDIRPALFTPLPLGAVPDLIDSCAPNATSEPFVWITYTELATPGGDALPWTLYLQTAETAPAKVAECMRASMLKAGAVEIPESEPDTDSTTSASSGSGDDSTGTTG
jgi:hypothetical protein